VQDQVIQAQKEAVIKEVATLKIQLDFMTKEHEALVKKTKEKEKKEQLAQQKLQRLIPMQDNINYKIKYYEYLCEL